MGFARKVLLRNKFYAGLSNHLPYNPPLREFILREVT